MVAVGIFVSGLFYPPNSSDKQLLTFEIKDYYLAEVCEKPSEKTKSFQSIVLIHGRTLKKPEKVIVYFSKENFDSTIAVGDQLIILAKPQEIKNMGNPFEFDYRSMMHNKGIYYSVFLKHTDYTKTGNKIFRISYLAEQVRDKLLKVLATSRLEKEEKSVVSALTLGYRAELEPETRDYFASTGAMHVLAVSGLHVGLIYLILNFFLKRVQNSKTGRILHPIAIISFLWFYAFITGFSPSVQRATVMFTFVIIGNSMRRPINIFNSIAASALLLMLHNPKVIFEVGFQLSYLALLGIVLLQPPMESVIPIKNKFLKWLWALFTVSLAAQLSTFPLGVFYFNQFPNFFWLSNFVVIPGAMIIFWSSFAFFLSSPLPFISDIISEVIQFFTNLMLTILKWISELPHAIYDGLIFSHLQVLLIYTILTAFIIFLFSKQKAFFFAATIMFIVLQISILNEKYRLLNQQIVQIYNSPNSIVHLINGRTNYVFSANNQPITDQEIKMIENMKIHLKLDKPKLMELKTMNGIKTDDLMINKQSICFLNCRLNISNQLNFEIHEKNTNRFIQQNKWLANQTKIITTIEGENSYPSGKQISVHTFTTGVKKPISVSLN